MKVLILKQNNLDLAGLRLDFQPFWESGVSSSQNGWKSSLGWAVLRSQKVGCWLCVMELSVKK